MDKQRVNSTVSGVSSRTAFLLAELKKLNDEDYKDFFFNAIDNDRPPEVNRNVMKRLTKISQKNSKNNPCVKLSGADYQGIDTSRPSASSETKSGSASAWNTPFIYRGDLAQPQSYLFIDVEKISLKMESGQTKHETVAETIAVVNEDRDLVFWCFVKWPERDVCQLFPNITNLSREKLSIGIEITMVREMIAKILQGNKLVGYDLKNDLDSIGIEHCDVEDLSEYFVEYKPPARPGSKPQYIKYSLKDVAKKLCPIQEFQCQVHSAISDARMTRDVWKKKQELLKLYPNHKIYPNEITRSARTKFVNAPGDVCRCKNSSKKRKGPAYMYPPS